MTKAFGFAVAALLASGSTLVLAQSQPEDLLPPGFDQPAPTPSPARSPRPSSAATGTAAPDPAAPALQPGEVVQALPGDSGEDTPLGSGIDLSRLPTLEQLEAGETHDELWNAAQREMAATGEMHNYVRMLWGKKILQWSATPRDALATMIDLNNRYALDGRDPNSYSGIFWILGRYDRPWGPERPIFGTVRYMSSENTARKVRVRDYLARYAEQPTLWASSP